VFGGGHASELSKHAVTDVFNDHAAMLDDLGIDQDAPPAFLVGRWVVSLVPTGDRLTDITLAEDGKYQWGAWGRNYGGPNGLDASRYKYDGGILTFFYPHDGRKPDIMLEGRLTPPGAQNQYDFEVTGGYYGTRVLDCTEYAPNESSFRILSSASVMSGCSAIKFLTTSSCAARTNSL